MPVLVEDVMPAKTGKSLRVKLGGTWYGSSLDSGLNGAKGTMIEAEIETGKFGPWIKKWLPSAVPAIAQGLQGAGAAVAGAPTVRVPEPEYAKPAPAGTVAPYWLPMASNVVAHAIQAGIITSPNQIGAWLRATEAAVVGNSVKDDDIPF